MPIGNGHIRVPYPDRYDIPPSRQIGDDGEEAWAYALSDTHQLHCLGMIGDVLIGCTIGEYVSNFAYGSHIFHCIDYLLCAGDATLEPAKMV